MKIGTILRSPLLHFFVLGGLVFAFYAVMTPPEARAPRDDVLRLTVADLNRMADGFLASRSRTPTAAESRALVRDWAIEEALVREALALGLDQGDAMIRNRLRTKMEFLTEAPAAAMQPDEDTLQAFYTENADLYARPAELSFAQVMLPNDTTSDEISALLDELRPGADAESLGQATMLSPRIDAMVAAVVERVFGNGFADAAAALPNARWSGPVESSFGLHLVRLDALEAAQLRPLASQRDKVAAEARKMRAAFTEDLLRRYRLEMPGETPEIRP